MSFIAHTGWWWLDAVVYAVSGGAFLAICYLAPSYFRNVIKPVVDAVVAEILAQLERKRKE